MLFESEILEDRIDEAREKLRNAIPISTYLSDNGFRVYETSGAINCPNPNHDDHSPSFRYDDSSGSCNCFGCELRGTVVELNYRLQLVDNPEYSILKSIYDLAREYKVQLPDMRDNRYSLTKNKIAPMKRERYKEIEKEEVYRQRVVKLSRLAKRVDATVEERMAFYRVIDDMWKGRLSPKEAYMKLKKGN